MDWSHTDTHLPYLLAVTERLHFFMGGRLGVEDMGVLCRLKRVLREPVGAEGLLVGHMECLAHHQGQPSGLQGGGAGGGVTGFCT